MKQATFKAKELCKVSEKSDQKEEDLQMILNKSMSCYPLANLSGQCTIECNQML